MPFLAALTLLARMQAVDSDLHSYTAQMHAHVALSTFPFLATDIAGTFYHKDPDLNKIEVTSGLPALAQNFSKLYAHVEPPSQWDTLYTVTAGRDDGQTALFTLVPKKQGNIAKITVTVDDATAVVRSQRWDYVNGGWASVDNRYMRVGNDLVLAGQSGHVQEPAYAGSIQATFSDYTMNPNLPDSIFTQ
jgi:outer membrane lipoprotein-sorting protein